MGISEHTTVCVNINKHEAMGIYAHTYLLRGAESFLRSWPVFVASQEIPHIFMEPEGSIQYSQVPATICSHYSMHIRKHAQSNSLCCYTSFDACAVCTPVHLHSVYFVWVGTRLQQAGAHAICSAHSPAGVRSPAQSLQMLQSEPVLVSTVPGLRIPRSTRGDTWTP
jgi:hypothetical protein